MNTHIEAFFTAVEARLPRKDLVTSKDLVDAGIITNINTLVNWRNNGQGPSFLRISSGQVRYLRSSVMEWLRSTYQQKHPSADTGVVAHV